MPRHRAASATEPGGLLIRVGGVLFLLGFVACCLDVLPHPFTPENRPLPLNVLAYATSAGMALAIWGLWRSIRASMRASAALMDEQPS